MSRSRSRQIIFKNSLLRSISMYNKTPSFISSNDDNAIDRFSQKPKRYRGSIIFSQKPKRYRGSIIQKIQLSQNDDKKKKKDSAIYPSSSSQRQNIVWEIQLCKKQFEIHLNTIENAIKRITERTIKISEGEQEQKLLRQKQLIAALDGNFQLVNWLQIQQKEVIQFLKDLNQQRNQLERNKKDQLNQLKKLKQKKKQLQQQQLEHFKRLPKIK